MGPQPSCRSDHAPRSIDRSVQYCSRRPRKPAHPTMERCKDRHCRRGAAALLFGLQTTGRSFPPCYPRARGLSPPARQRAFTLRSSPNRATSTPMTKGSDKVTTASRVMAASTTSLAMNCIELARGNSPLTRTPRRKTISLATVARIDGEAVEPDVRKIAAIFLKFQSRAPPRRHDRIGNDNRPAHHR